MRYVVVRSIDRDAKKIGSAETSEEARELMIEDFKKTFSQNIKMR